MALARGRSVVVAGGETGVALHETRGELEATFEPTQTRMGATLGHFGLRPHSGLVLDASGAQLPHGGGVAAPFFIQSVPYSDDFRTLRGQPNGALLFLAPMALALDGPDCS